MTENTSADKEKKNNPKLPSNLPERKITSVSSDVVFPDIEVIENLVDRIATSSLAKPFQYKDADGKTVVNKGDIVSCIALGYELGISPMASLSLGKRLDANAYFSVKKGEAMGLDPVTSISKIYNIETRRGTILYTGVDVISAAILRTGTKMDIINDFVTAPMFYEMVGNKYVGHYFELFPKGELIDSMFLYVDKVSTPEDVKAANEAGKIIIKRSSPITTTKVTTIRFTRNIGKEEKSITIHYSLQQAIDAGLYKGYHSSDVDQSGKPIWIEGKDNWLAHPATMLRNRCISIGGRIIAADALGGIYSKDEVMDMEDVEIEDATVID